MDNTGNDNNVDMFLQTMKEKQEIDDYITNGKYPDRLKTTFVKKYFPKMEETVIYEPIKLQNNETDNLNNNIDNIRQSLNALELEIKTEIQREITQPNNLNECPICMEEIKERNYVMPKCGHLVCVKCFVINMKTNHNTGHLCSQCRQIVI
jgi:hypothetical protein